MGATGEEKSLQERAEKEATPDTILQRIEGKAVPAGGTHNSEEAILGHKGPRPKDKKFMSISGTEVTERGHRGCFVHQDTETHWSQPMTRSGDQK